MLKAQDPLTLYKQGQECRVPAVDAPAWIRLGWSTESSIAETEEPSENTNSESSGEQETNSDKTQAIENAKPEIVKQEQKPNDSKPPIKKS
jgi:hypothetical protein